ncbi:RNA-binding 15 [Brachionus plicatilis]|uniref:RNA-binding 15 n=1 Tax=Brachionus plicatilis TaxID=10195 RepID=A0A3M7PJN4_BRAPC|nr:RNA-binding 15 [Brachionus plicatilis]
MNGYKSKVQATNCLWIGGLRDSANILDLEKKIKSILNTNDSSKYDILYTSPNNYAFVLFYNVKHAEEVRYELRNKKLPRSDKLRIDFHDPKKFTLLQPKPRKSRSPTSPAKRRLVQPDTQAPQDDAAAETKSKKSKLPNGAEPKPNYENIIITKTDNVRRVDAVGSKNRSRSRTASPVQPKKKRSSSPNGHSNGDSQADKREFELAKQRDEGEIAEESRPGRHVIESSWLLDESHVHLSRSVMTKSMKSVADMKTLLEPYSNWSGQLTLKKNSFPVKFYLMAGNQQLAETFLPAHNTDMNLHINQRIRLDSSKLDDIEKRLSERFECDDSVTYSVFVCVATQLTKSDKSVLHKRSLHNLVSYLNQKSAAGVVNLPDDARVHANLNIFTASSNLSSRVFKQLLAGFRAEQLSQEQDSFLICVLLKSGSV